MAGSLLGDGAELGSSKGENSRLSSEKAVEPVFSVLIEELSPSFGVSFSGRRRRDFEIGFLNIFRNGDNGTSVPSPSRDS